MGNPLPAARTDELPMNPNKLIGVRRALVVISVCLRRVPTLAYGTARRRRRFLSWKGICRRERSRRPVPSRLWFRSRPTRQRQSAGLSRSRNGPRRAVWPVSCVVAEAHRYCRRYWDPRRRRTLLGHRAFPSPDPKVQRRAYLIRCRVILVRLIPVPRAVSSAVNRSRPAAHCNREPLRALKSRPSQPGCVEIRTVAGPASAVFGGGPYTV
jgi:hypothetical protein